MSSRAPVSVAAAPLRPKLLTPRAPARLDPGPAPVLRLATSSHVRGPEVVFRAAQFTIWMIDSGTSIVAMAAALDMQPRRVVEMRKGERPIRYDHVMLAARRLPGFGALVWSSIQREIGGGLAR